MAETAVNALLERAKAGRISTIGADGYPYTVAVHFVMINGNVYFHGLGRGEKLDNIQNNNKVCFEVDEYTRLMADGLKSPCDADAEYESVVIRGKAVILDNFDLKKKVLTEIIRKFAPHLENLAMPDARIKGTAVVQITPNSVTGKYHK
ncbi:MAG: pyridoxamine 5'-phosphate oxidase family protein [Clostridiales bacterium]|nr:pyridoxamine 5'-phosphate oxidase family protein [Clostridiales bacterium]